MSDFNLKPGWKLFRFDQMAYEVKDRIDRPVESGLERYVGLEHLDTDSLKIWRWGSTTDVKKQKLLFKKGDIIFGRRNAYLRRVAVADFDGVCSAHAMVLRAHKEVVLPEFLPFFMQMNRFWEAALKVSAGSMSPTINWRNIAKQEFVLPPLKEQRRLVNVLLQIEQVLKTLKELVGATYILVESVVKDFFDSVKATEPFQLSELADIRYGLTVNRTRRTASLKVPYLRVANVMRGHLDLNEVKNIGFMEGDNIYVLKPKDVLIVEGHANPTEIGRAALWNSEIEQCLHQNHLIRVRCQNGLDPNFLVIYLNSTHGRKHFLAHSKSTSGLNTINSTVVREVPVPKISIDLQKTLVVMVNKILSQTHQSNTRYEATLFLKSNLLMELESKS